MKCKISRRRVSSSSPYQPHEHASELPHGYLGRYLGTKELRGGHKTKREREDSQVHLATVLGGMVYLTIILTYLSSGPWPVCRSRQTTVSVAVSDSNFHDGPRATCVVSVPSGIS